MISDQSEQHDWYLPGCDFVRGGREFVDFFAAVNFTEADFRGLKTNRLPQLKTFLIEIVK